MTPVAEALLADIESEKTGLRHLPEILVVAEQARKNGRITKRELNKILQAVVVKDSVLEEAKHLAIEQDRKKQKSLF